MASKFVLAVIPLFLDIQSTWAACDNACSGHGTCSFKDICTCWQNWQMGDEDGGDCSDRQCPFELAWVDSPDKSGKFHKYAECAGRGICDRGTGECQCFEGYSGKGCQRTTCPNDCSGHGTCQFIEDLYFAENYGSYYDASSVDYQGHGDEPVTLYYTTPESYERHHMCDLGEKSKEDWRNRRKMFISEEVYEEGDVEIK